MVSEPWPTLPDPSSVQIDQLSQYSLSVSVRPPEGFVGFRCFTAAPPCPPASACETSFVTMSIVNAVPTETIHAPIFGSDSTSITGFVDRSLLTGYSTGRVAAFSISAGDPCSLSSDKCVTSPLYPLHYGTGTQSVTTCTITVRAAGLVTAAHFDTEITNDFVTINGAKYHGTAGPSAIQVTAGAQIDFYADDRVHGTGWEICFSPVSTPASTPTPPAPLVMKIGTTDGSQSANACSEQLQPCIEYQLRCEVQNTAGWSTVAELPVPPAILQTAPHPPDKPPQPLINQLDEAGVAALSDQFTVIIAKPEDSATFGGFCSVYTFRLRVTHGVETIIDQTDLPAGEHLVDTLTPATAYSVVVQAQNQNGWGAASDTKEANNFTLAHCVITQFGFFVSL